MSLLPQPWPEPDDEVARVVAAIYAGRRKPLPVAVRDELGELFADEQFTAGFSDRGPRGWSPGRLMLVTVLQAAGNLTDRQAADTVRSDLSWKYALGLGLTDPGFDASILSEFRTRLSAHDLHTRALDLLIARLVDKGLLKAGGKQRTDSTHVLAAVRTLNWVELVGESVRACLEVLAAADPQWTATVLDASWQDRYGARVDGWRLPSSRTARTKLAADFARDGYTLLRAVWHPGSPHWLRNLPAVDVLRRVLVQNTKITTGRDGREVITMRDPDTDGVPPGRSRLTSPYDLDTRWGAKRDLAWNGYKLHISESCDTEPPGTTSTPAPNLITNVTTTDASVPDVVMTEPIHHHLATRGLLPAEHYLDAGYSSAELLVTSLTGHGIRLITPILANTSTQARARQGYDRDAFTIDWTTRTVTCPNGATSRSWKPAVQHGTDVITIRFAGRDCQPCPAKTHCTTATRDGRQLTLRPQPIQQALDTARTEQTTTAWRTGYARRAGIESTIAQTTRTTGTRQARYRGLAKTSLEHNITATAINLIRLNTWWNNQTPNPRPTSHLSRLNLALAA
jgi:transposase